MRDSLNSALAVSFFTSHIEAPGDSENPTDGKADSGK